MDTTKPDNERMNLTVRPVTHLAGSMGQQQTERERARCVPSCPQVMRGVSELRKGSRGVEVEGQAGHRRDFTVGFLPHASVRDAGNFGELCLRLASPSCRCATRTGAWRHAPSRPSPPRGAGFSQQVSSRPFLISPLRRNIIEYNCTWSHARGGLLISASSLTSA